MNLINKALIKTLKKISFYAGIFFLVMVGGLAVGTSIALLARANPAISLGVFIIVVFGFLFYDAYLDVQLEQKLEDLRKLAEDDEKDFG